MTNEQKLKRLLEVAIENGWENVGSYLNILTSKNVRFADVDMINCRIKYAPTNDQQFYILSINDLVTNFELGEISFINALCNADPDSINQYLETNAIQSEYCWIMWSDWEQVIQLWSWDSKKEKGRPTSERLDWLFDTFAHLLV